MFLKPALASPQRFWEEVKRAYEEVGANAFYKVFDSLSSFPPYLEGLVKTKPKDLGFEPRFFIYAQALDIVKNTKVLDLLKALGVYKLNIGVESFSDRTLKYMKSERDSVEVNFKALRLAKEKGFDVYASFPLGSKVETLETLKETLKGIEKILKEGLVNDVEVQPIMPLPNNELGKEMKEAGLWVVDEEFPEWPRNISKMSEVYINNFSGVSYQEVIDFMKRVRELAEKYGEDVVVGSGVTKEL